MKNSREILTRAGLLPKLQLGIRKGTGRFKNGVEVMQVVSTGKHTVKVLEDKIIRKPPREEGEDGYFMRYVFEENGEKKQYDTRLKQKGGEDPSYFVQAMADIQPGEEITLEMKKAGVKNYVEIVRLSLGEVEHVSDDDEPQDDMPDTDAEREQGAPEGTDLAEDLKTIHM